MDSNTGKVEILSKSVRTSCRKSKRKTFDDFVSTEDAFETDHNAAVTSLKLVKKETKDCELLKTKAPHEPGQSKEIKIEHETTENEKITEQNIKAEVSKKSKTARTILKPKKRGSRAKIKPNSIEKAQNNNPSNQGEDEINQSLKERKERHSCKKSNCRKEGLICCLQATNMCMEASGKCSRWYHMSLEEHYCNGCFEQYYRVKHSGCEEFHEWKRQWMQNSKTDATFKNLTTYISERQLPYWVQCNTCSHWRQLTNEIDLTPEIVATYVCNMGNLSNTMEDDNKESCLTKRSPHVKYLCHKNQDPGVVTAINPSVSWMPLLSYTPFLKNSPAAPFLTEYYPDGVGMSAVDTVNVRELEEFASNSGEDDVLLPPIVKQLKKEKKFNAINSLPEKYNQAVKTSMMMSPGGRKQRETSTLTVPVKKLNPFFQPFYKPHEGGKACCMRPDVMELDEAEEFPEYYRDQSVYLAIRNVIVALWVLNPKQILTAKKCFPHILFRGLTRARLCTLVVPRIIQFATRKGLINTGALRFPKSVGNGDSKTYGLLPEIYTNQKVIVVGCGPAGLAAARQLHNFGCEVVCLEARDRVGGRVHDDWSLDGVCVGTGAQIINGCVNNPLALISHQLGLNLHILRSRCDLFDGEESGASGENPPVSSHCDKRMDFHFNALLDIIAEWRQAQGDFAEDCSLGEKILEAHREWIKQSGLAFTQLEERLLNFHIGNLEFACGANLDNVSAFNWDQNEIFSQFCGEHAFVQYGFDTPLSALATDLDIKYKSEVTDISYNEKKPMVEVKTSRGDTHRADRVLVTVPLAVLRSGSIKFHPELPKAKKQSMNRLGCGCIEKVGLLFSNRFWDTKIDGANYFGYVPASTSKKGFFTMFYDVPYVSGEKSNVLMSVLSGDSVELAQNMSDEEIVDIALSNLQNIFREIKIEKPLKFFVTRWRDDPYARMAYSYVRKGSSGEDYDEMAVEIDNRIYFAGEGTNRHFPQTVTGAYLSGLREASKIAVANAEEKTGCELGRFPIESLLDLKT